MESSESRNLKQRIPWEFSGGKNNHKPPQDAGREKLAGDSTKVDPMRSLRVSGFLMVKIIAD